MSFEPLCTKEANARDINRGLAEKLVGGRSEALTSARDDPNWQAPSLLHHPVFLVLILSDFHDF